MGGNELSAPARFAQAVRGLALDAHRTLTRSPSEAALQRLSRRIAVLVEALEDRRRSPIAAWLDNLERDVQSAARRARPKPPHATPWVDESLAPTDVWARIPGATGRCGF